MSIVYNEYYRAYENGTLDIENVHFGVKLVDGSYYPGLTDKLSDVEGVILDAPVALVDEVMTLKGMSEIVEILKKRLRAYANMTPNPPMMMETPVLDEKYKTALSSTNPADLREAGARYLVVYSTVLNILCFTEEV